MLRPGPTAGSGGGGGAADPTALKKANNLSDVNDAAASRSNIDAEQAGAAQNEANLRQAANGLTQTIYFNYQRINSLGDANPQWPHGAVNFGTADASYLHLLGVTDVLADGTQSPSRAKWQGWISRVRTGALTLNLPIGPNINDIVDLWVVRGTQTATVDAGGGNTVDGGQTITVGSNQVVRMVCTGVGPVTWSANGIGIDDFRRACLRESVDQALADQSTQAIRLHMGYREIAEVADPTYPHGAANKQYADSKARAGISTANYQPQFYPVAQIGAYMVDFGVPAAAGTTLSPAMASDSGYPLDPIAQPDCPRMIRIVLSMDWASTDDVYFTVASQVDFSIFSAAYTVPANTPGGTVLGFINDASTVPISSILAISCTPPAGWTAGTATIETDDALQILPVLYYSRGTCTVQAEWSGTPGGLLTNNGTVGNVGRAALGDGVRPLYLPAATLNGTTQVKALIRIDDAAGGAVENHSHGQQA